MAKRRKRKHRVSAQYLLFASKTKTASIIPTITKKARQSKTETKKIRDSIRKAYSEQIKVETPRPSKEYNTNKKKNRRQAREKRKERKKKAKQLQEQRQIQQEQEEPTLDYTERDANYRTTETPELDDTTNYIEDLISLINEAEEQLSETFAKWYDGISTMLSSLDRLQYWLEESLQLPYEQKRIICDTLEGNQYLEQITNAMHYQYYKDVEEAIDAISDEIILVIESVY